MKFEPHPYQEKALAHVLDHPYTGLFLDMGLGKTVVALSAANILMYERLEVEKVLVIAPKKVAESTWSNEASKWGHLKHLRVSVVMGSERKRVEALRADADLYVINRENVAWLVGYYQTAFPFDMVLIDELSSFKSNKSIRFKALRMVRPKVRRLVGLTGTPRPNGLIDLWAQMYLLDMGERLGKTLTGFRQRYFTPGRTNGQIVFEYNPREDSEQAVYSKISDICISMRAEDYLTLPPRIDRTVSVNLPDAILRKYEEFEKKQILALPDEKDISAVNAAALSGKLLQFASGAVYDADHNWYEVHREKLEALGEIVEAAAGPVLVFYSFLHDLERIQDYLRAYHPRQYKTAEDGVNWNAGKIRVMLAHPASTAYGLNLQAGGNTIVWFSLNWSLELYEQANARLHRQGQEKPVIVHHLVTRGTHDEDILPALENKAQGQNGMKEALSVRIRKYRT